MIRSILFNRNQKRILNAKSSSGILLDPEKVNNEILSINVLNLRYWIFLTFLIVEIIFGFNKCLYGVLNNFVPFISIDIGNNCTLQHDSYLNYDYDLSAGSFMLNLMIVVESFSFSLMIWMFGISLLNLQQLLCNNTYDIIHYLSHSGNIF